MYQSFVARGRVIPVSLAFDEIVFLAREPVRELFSANERALIDFAESDPALRSFLDRALTATDVESIDIALPEEFRKYSRSEQAALGKALHFRIVLRRYAVNVQSFISKFPAPSDERH
jgi:hypothetical protein